MGATRPSSILVFSQNDAKSGGRVSGGERVIYGQRVPSDGHVTFSACNFSGTTQTAIVDLPVRVITFG